MAKAQKKKSRFRKRFMVCKEIRMGKYEMPDCGAIHTSLESAKNHAKDCDDGTGHIFVLPIYDASGKAHD